MSQEASDAAKLLALGHVPQTAEEQLSWQAYFHRVEELQGVHCPGCPLSLICLAQSYPDDDLFCVACKAQYNNRLALRILCAGYRARTTGLMSSGICWYCKGVQSLSGCTGVYTTVQGFDAGPLPSFKQLEHGAPSAFLIDANDPPEE